MSARKRPSSPPDHRITNFFTSSNKVMMSAFARDHRAEGIITEGIGDVLVQEGRADHAEKTVEQARAAEEELSIKLKEIKAEMLENIPMDNPDDVDDLLATLEERFYYTKAQVEQHKLQSINKNLPDAADPRVKAIKELRANCQDVIANAFRSDIEVITIDQTLLIRENTEQKRENRELRARLEEVTEQLEASRTELETLRAHWTMMKDGLVVVDAAVTDLIEQQRAAGETALGVFELAANRLQSLRHRH